MTKIKKLGLKAVAALIISALGYSAALAQTYTLRVALPGLQSSKATLSGMLKLKDTTNSAELTAVNFPTTQVGQTSAAVAVSLSNTGKGDVVFGGSPISVAAPFNLVSSSCVTKLSPAQSCAITLNFRPTEVKTYDISGLVVQSNATSTAMPHLVGIGSAIPAPIWTVEPSPSLTFASTAVNTYATADSVISITNTGAATGTLTLPAFTGTNASEYSATTTCTSVAPNNSCLITTRFKPTATGSRTASLVLSTRTLDFTGTGAPSAADPYFADVSLLLHMDGPSNTFVDVKGATVSRFGNATTVTGPAKFGGALYGDGNSSYLSVPASSKYLMSGDATIEAWVYFTDLSVDQDIVSNYVSASTADWTLKVTASGRVFQFYAHDASKIASPAITTNTWYHVAATRSGSTCHLFVNGTEVGNTACGSALGDSSRTVRIGSRQGSGGFLRGYVDDVRITKVARYTANFAVPAAAFPDQ